MLIYYLFLQKVLCSQYYDSNMQLDNETNEVDDIETQKNIKKDKNIDNITNQKPYPLKRSRRKLNLFADDKADNREDIVDEEGYNNSNSDKVINRKRKGEPIDIKEHFTPIKYENESYLTPEKLKYDIITEFYYFMKNEDVKSHENINNDDRMDIKSDYSSEETLSADSMKFEQQ